MVHGCVSSKTMSKHAKKQQKVFGFAIVNAIAVARLKGKSPHKNGDSQPYE
jgi:hypothetical protein